MRTILSGLFPWMFFILAAVAPGGALQSQTTVSGTITTPPGDPLPGVVVEISGSVSGFVITDTLGHYSAVLPAGGAYTLAPRSNAQPLNGVSTFDMALILRHIQGIELFDSPYKIIAADVSNNGLLDPADSLEIRQLLTGMVAEFPNNSSWRFVLANYVFPDPANPFQPPFPEAYTTPNLSASVGDVDFIAMKTGDVNYTAVLSNLTDSSYLSWIDGTVRIDADTDCVLDAGEAPLQNWLAKASGAFGTYWGKTNADGQFAITAPPGVYELELLAPNGLWAPCAGILPGITTAQLGHTPLEFPVQVVAECPYLEVDLSALFLRRCFPSTYHLYYCNQGTTVAENAYVYIAFDTFLTVQGSSVPWSAVSGNIYTFPLGDVAPGACGALQVSVLVSCDADPGQTHCSYAHIYPDTMCLPPNPLWSGANLEVSGRCDPGEVIFTIKNTGAPMPQPADYVVIEDVIIQMSNGSVQLGANQTQEVTLPANGSTWRLELEQAPHHPWSQMPAAVVEGCGTNAGGSYSTGFVTLFPLGDENPAVDIDCQENISSYDPNDKGGTPRGVGAAHFIPKNEPISYKIRFQNTGTDTAFNIRITDTLSALLDIATLRPGSSSHPYSYQLLGGGVLQFLFQNIMLPDSHVNEPLSHGFVQFTIAPKADLPNNAGIENTAAIYFDFNAAVLTNRTLHTVGEQYLQVSNVIFRPGIELTVFPNPAAGRATFQLNSPRPLRGNLLLFDALGRLQRKQRFDGNVFEFQAAGLAPGLYFFRLESAEGGMLATGKLLLRAD